LSHRMLKRDKSRGRRERHVVLRVIMLRAQKLEMENQLAGSKRLA
jgi:hypothetical protein